MIYNSLYPDPVIPRISLPDYVLATASDRSARPALIDGTTGETLTYGDLLRLVPAIARSLAAAGVQPGDVVALMSPNRPAWAAAFYGTLAAGATVTALNPQLTQREVSRQLNESHAVALITDGSAMSVALAAGDAAAIPVLDLTSLCTAVGETAVVTDTHRGSSVDPESDVAVLAYSGGTTGLPKGVLLTHRNLVACLCQHEAVYHVDSRDVFLAVLPFFHIYGMSIILGYGLRHGATIVAMPRFDADRYLALIGERRVTRLHLAPPLATVVAAADLRFDLSSVRHAMSGAAPLDAATVVALEARLKCSVGQGYGMTEASPGVTWVPDVGATTAPGSVGHLLPGTQARVVDPVTLRDATESGELWIRGPQVMRGYLDNPVATDDAIVDGGWLRTGDAVRIDESGTVWVVDRLKEIIKYKGYQIAPAELEAVLREHPLVVDVAVIGVADTVAGEIPKAFVVRNDIDLTDAALIAWCAERVAPYKRPRAVEFVESIPRSTSGKVLRRILREGAQT
ncbi:MAG TPA: AMP-binding protein [Acidothermaceae bacterium]|jgi:acyl-CoA synthetase (AMP-forming)/AMP-acid ligase II